MDLNPFDVSFGMKDNGSPSRGRCDSSGKGLEETSPGKIRFQRKPDPGPISKSAALNVTIHGYQTRYQLRNVKAVAPRDTKQVFEREPSLSIRAVYYLSLSTNYFFCYLFFFSYLKCDPPGGYVETKKLLHTFRATLKENKRPSVRDRARVWLSLKQSLSR